MPEPWLSVALVVIVGGVAGLEDIRRRHKCVSGSFLRERDGRVVPEAGRTTEKWWEDDVCQKLDNHWRRMCCVYGSIIGVW